MASPQQLVRVRCDQEFLDQDSNRCGHFWWCSHFKQFLEASQPVPSLRLH